MQYQNYFFPHKFRHNLKEEKSSCLLWARDQEAEGEGQTHSSLLRSIGILR